MNIDHILEADGNVYRTHIPSHGVTFNFRLLSLKEYKVYRSFRDGGVLPEWSVADEVFERCFLGEASLISSDLPAGLTVSIGNLILYLSGDCDEVTLREDIARYRMLHPANTVFEHMRAVICSAFSYKIEDIDSWSRPEFLKKFTIAENVLAKQNPEFVRLNLSDIKTAEEAEQAQAQPQGHKIDFARENRDLTRAVGRLDQEEAQVNLTKEQLRTLSRKSSQARGR